MALDAWHVASATTRYAEPWICRIARWTIPLFAVAGVALGAIPVAVERALGVRIPPTTPRRVAGSVALFVLAYLLTGILRGAVCALALVVDHARAQDQPARALLTRRWMSRSSTFT